jgi:hypothetical protein
LAAAWVTKKGARARTAMIWAGSGHLDQRQGTQARMVLGRNPHSWLGSASAGARIGASAE